MLLPLHVLLWMYCYVQNTPQRGFYFTHRVAVGPGGVEGEPFLTSQGRDKPSALHKFLVSYEGVNAEEAKLVQVTDFRQH